MKCTKCNTDMKKGYFTDNSVVGIVEGSTRWRGVDENNHATGQVLEVIAYSCSNCGFIESYLNKN